MEKRKDNRISPTDAREFAREVHVHDSPQLLRQYSSRTEAGTRRWEFSTSRQVFKGLGLDFFVDRVPATFDLSEGEWGVWARPSKDSRTFIAYLTNGEPCLVLDPHKAGKDLNASFKEITDDEEKPQVTDVEDDTSTMDTPGKAKLAEFKAPSPA